MNTNQKNLFLALSPFASFLTGSIPGLSVIVPLILWIMWKNEPDCDKAGKAVLNGQISWLIYIFVACLLCFLLIGFILAPVALILWFVYTILQALAFNKGDYDYRMLWTINFIK